MAGERLVFHDSSVIYFGCPMSEKMRRNILAQGLSAVIKYPKERRPLDREFKPFVFLTQSEAPQLIVGDLVGRWDESGNIFRLESIRIIDGRDNIWEMLKLIGIITHLNPGIPKLCSDSFEEVIAQSRRAITVSGAQESAFDVDF